MTMTKLKAGIIGAAAVLGVATPFVIQHSNKLYEENVSLQKQLEVKTPLRTEISRLSNQHLLAVLHLLAGSTRGVLRGVKASLALIVGSLFRRLSAG
jgi:hypothetical protein